MSLIPSSTITAIYQICPHMFRLIVVLHKNTALRLPNTIAIASPRSTSLLTASPTTPIIRQSPSIPSYNSNILTISPSNHDHPNQTTPQTPFIAISDSYLAPINDLPPSASDSSSLALLPHPLLSKLRTVGTPRIKDMRAAGVAMQILSHVPLTTTPVSCAEINDALNGAICLSPDHFSGLALLPSCDGKEAAKELQRCVTRYRFVGGVLGVGNEVRIDCVGFEELWKAAEKYRVPVAIREGWPGLEEARESFPSLPKLGIGLLVASLYAGHAASPVPLVQLYAAGMFDRHPNLRLILSRASLSYSRVSPPAYRGRVSHIPCDRSAAPWT